MTTTALEVNVVALRVHCRSCGYAVRIATKDTFNEGLTESVSRWWTVHLDPRIEAVEVITNGEYAEWVPVS